MAKCDVCGRSATKGRKKSHSNIKTLKRQKINVQNKKTEDGKKKICTSCLKNQAKLN